MLLTHITSSGQNLGKRSHKKDEVCPVLDSRHNLVYHARDDTSSGTFFYEYRRVRWLAKGVALRCPAKKCDAKISLGFKPIIETEHVENKRTFKLKDTVSEQIVRDVDVRRNILAEVKNCLNT